MITSTANPAVKAARRLAHGPARARRDAFLVEGPKAVGEGVSHLRQLFATSSALGRHGALVAAARKAGAEVLEVSEVVLAELAGTVHPQGLVGVATRAEPDLDGVLAAARLLVVLVGAGDPGNVGTVIRTADAAGADAVILTAGSADPHNPKAVRASSGSLFHLPVVRGAEPDEIVGHCRRRGLRPLALHAGGEVAHTETDLGTPVALLFGAEAHGLPPAVAAACDARVRVPILGRAESLNLAATVAVVLYEAARQRAHLAPLAGRP